MPVTVYLARKCYIILTKHTLVSLKWILYVIFTAVSFFYRWPCDLQKTLDMLFKYGKSLLLKKVQRV